MEISFNSLMVGEVKQPSKDRWTELGAQQLEINDVAFIVGLLP